MKIRKILTTLAVVTTGAYLVKKTAEAISEVQIIEPKEKEYNLEDKSVIVIDVDKFEEIEAVKKYKKETIKDRIMRLLNRHRIVMQ